MGGYLQHFIKIVWWPGSEFRVIHVIQLPIDSIRDENSLKQKVVESFRLPSGERLKNCDDEKTPTIACVAKIRVEDTSWSCDASNLIIKTWCTDSLQRKFKLTLGGFQKSETAASSDERRQLKTISALLIRPQTCQKLQKLLNKPWINLTLNSFIFTELQRQRRWKDRFVPHQHGSRPVHLCQMPNRQEDPEDSHGEVRRTWRIHEPCAPAGNKGTDAIRWNWRTTTICWRPIYRRKWKLVHYWIRVIVKTLPLLTKRTSRGAIVFHLSLFSLTNEKLASISCAIMAASDCITHRELTVEMRIWSQKPQELMQLQANASIIAFLSLSFRTLIMWNDWTSWASWE